MDPSIAKGLARTFIRETKKGMRETDAFDELLADVYADRTKKLKFSYIDCKRHFNHLEKSVHSNPNLASYQSFGKKPNSTKFDRTGIAIMTDVHNVNGIDENDEAGMEEMIGTTLKLFRVTKTCFEGGYGGTDTWIRPHFLARLFERGYERASDVDFSRVRKLISDITLFANNPIFCARNLVEPVVVPAFDGLALGFAFMRPNYQEHSFYMKMDKNGPICEDLPEHSTNADVYFSTFISEKELKKEQDYIADLLTGQMFATSGVTMAIALLQNFGRRGMNLIDDETMKADIPGLLADYREITETAEFEGFRNMSRNGKFKPQVELFMKMTRDHFGENSVPTMENAINTAIDERIVRSLRSGTEDVEDNFEDTFLIRT